MLLFEIDGLDVGLVLPLLNASGKVEELLAVLRDSRTNSLSRVSRDSPQKRKYLSTILLKKDSWALKSLSLKWSNVSYGSLGPEYRL
jgi:hypothetical protein